MRHALLLTQWEAVWYGWGIGARPVERAASQCEGPFILIPQDFVG